jgi:subtilisin
MQLPACDIDREWLLGGSTGAGVKVAVFDTGVDARHPLVGDVAGYAAFSESNAGLVCSAAPHDDAAGHGTAVASRVRAVAPECELYSVKVLGATVSGRAAVLAAGLRWAIDNGMDVCNLSLGTTKQDWFAVFQALCEEASVANVALVCAANNAPHPSAPAACAPAIAVGSHAVQDPICLRRSSDPHAELLAWGINVPILGVDGTWKTASGNSLATPHVTGLIARLRASHPELSVCQFKTVLLQLAGSIPAGESDRSPARV